MTRSMNTKQIQQTTKGYSRKAILTLKVTKSTADNKRFVITFHNNIGYYEGMIFR